MRIQRAWKPPVIHEVVKAIVENEVVVTMCRRWIVTAGYEEVTGEVTCSQCLLEMQPKKEG